MNKIAALCLLITACDTQEELTKEELSSLPVEEQCKTLLEILCDHQVSSRTKDLKEIPQLREECQSQTDCSTKILVVPDKQLYQCYLCLLDSTCWDYTITELKQMPVVCDHIFL